MAIVDSFCVSDWKITLRCGPFQETFSLFNQTASLEIGGVNLDPFRSLVLSVRRACKYLTKANVTVDENPTEAKQNHNPSLNIHRVRRNISILLPKQGSLILWEGCALRRSFSPDRILMNHYTWGFIACRQMSTSLLITSAFLWSSGIGVSFTLAEVRRGCWNINEGVLFGMSRYRLQLPKGKGENLSENWHRHVLFNCQMARWFLNIPFFWG